MSQVHIKRIGRIGRIATMALLSFGLVPLGAIGCGTADEQTELPEEAALGTVASALVNPKVTEVVGFVIPDALLELPQRVIIRSTAEATRLLGSMPAGVDFTKEFLVFYAAGAQPTLGFSAQVLIPSANVEMRLSGGTYTFRLKVDATMVLDPPGTGCAAERPGISRPFMLLRVDATSLRDYSQVSSHTLSYRQQNNNRTCAPEPGAICDGKVTPSGLSAIKLRPRDPSGVPTYSTYSVYAQHRLGSYTVERWQWDCKAGVCSWLEVPKKEWGPDYLQTGALYYYSTASEERLLLFSSTGTETFDAPSGPDYPCWLWGESVNPTLDTRSGTGVVSSSSITGHRVCSVAVGANYHGRNMGLNGFTGVMGDRCVRLTSGPVRVAGSVLQVLTSSW